MNKYLTVFVSFVIMLSIGSVYAWSIIASELIKSYGFSASQSQVIFGTLIAIFPITMIFVGQLGRKINHRFLGYISGLLFFSGYYLAGHSQGNFMLILLGIGVLGGIATGFGYWVALTLPVQWFPQKKGLVTGIAAAGFGFGGNFVLFAKETAQVFGLQNLGIIYPYIFLGYAIAGIAGPLSGGFLYDFLGSFSLAIVLASLMSLLGSLLFLNQFITSRKNEHIK